ncbi:hypothetical protein LOK49_LG15G01389 [Camellia lanceoleosa]|uniref:Uncharacterized protein n=1 Tax=Camellia lanceoleosa TaxID=1840588 RepID=A0ACC0F4K9_9ERIC|nr:hypothetical protein LOK49_LG15G01389 [Camellia lanceoleosa]
MVETMSGKRQSAKWWSPTVNLNRWQWGWRETRQLWWPSSHRSEDSNLQFEVVGLRTEFVDNGSKIAGSYMRLSIYSSNSSIHSVDGLRLHLEFSRCSCDAIDIFEELENQETLADDEEEEDEDFRKHF